MTGNPLSEWDEVRFPLAEQECRLGWRLRWPWTMVVARDVGHVQYGQDRKIHIPNPKFPF